jgi:class 3 adenylate cyclase/tetratricopeptide (TPR) repeat protein
MDGASLGAYSRDGASLMATIEKPSDLERQGEMLKPYVPRLLIEWLRVSPETSYRSVDGTMVFVDISGFTALTERLAGRGKVGAELLRDALDGVFRGLLDEAYAWGAGLLKWGGDALLLLFDGPNHETRAARAAWEMQQTSDRIGVIRVAGRTSTLRISIGMATGAIDFFTAGSVHRELLVVGPTATETVAMESVAEPGEICISPGLAAVLDPACLGPPRADARLLLGAPEAAREPAPDVGTMLGIDVASCIPVASRSHMLLERPEPEHRAITAAFVELMDTDVLLARLGPAAFAEALDERISSIEESALRHQVPFNVTDVARGSVKVLLTAGAPSSTGHDEEQMLRTVREVIDQPGVIPLRAGVNSGKVFTGDFGPPYRRAYAVLGDAINTAARVMSRAEPGQILSTDAVLERSRTAFATTPIEAFRAKGKAELLAASVVGPIVGRRGERHRDAPFVGREELVAALLGIIHEVKAGNGWTVEIAGAAGIGKSRLVRQVLALTPEVRTLHVTCEEYEASTPYYAMREPMRDLLGLDRESSAAESERRLREVVAETASDLVPWTPLLAVLLGLDVERTPETAALDERFLPEILADVTLRFLSATRTHAATAIVVEDAHFMDGATSDLLHRLSAASTSFPHALFITQSVLSANWARVDEERERHLCFALLPLAERDAARVVDLVTDDEPLRPHEVEEIARRSGGSPLFVLELLDVAHATGTTEALPDSVEAAIAAEIDRLAPPDRTVLRYASVLGTVFDRSLLTAALHDNVELDDAVWERMGGLVEAGPAGRMRFRNTLVRDAAYEGLPFRRRRELHALVAEAIEATTDALEDEAATLALHFFAAGHRDKTWQYGRIAGDRARAVGATVEAARLYELALKAGCHVRSVSRQQRADVLVALGKVREAAGLFDESVDAFRRASRLLPDDPVERARIFALRTRPNVRTGAWGRALRETSAGLRLLEGQRGRPAAAARAMLRAMRAELLMFQGRAREAIPLAATAAEEARRTGELEATARAYTALDGSYQLLGEPEKAVHERLAVDIYTKLGDVNARGLMQINLGVQSYADGRWSEALELYARARDDCQRSGDRQNAAVAAANLGELLVSKGEIEEAERVLGDARRVLRSSRYASFVLFADMQLARCALHRGDATAAFETLDRVVAEAKGVGHAGMSLEAAAYRAHAHARAGSAEKGLASLDSEAMTTRKGAIWHAAAIERARAACLSALGRNEEARVCLDKALGVAKGQGLLYEELLIRKDRAGLVGAGLDAGEELREAERLAQLLGIADF